MNQHESLLRSFGFKTFGFQPASRLAVEQFLRQRSEANVLTGDGSFLMFPANPLLHVYTVYTYKIICMYVCMHVCMYACMHVCMYACMHVCMYVCMHLSTCIYMYLHVSTCIYMYLHVSTCIYMYLHVSTCIPVWAEFWRALSGFNKFSQTQQGYIISEH